MSISRERKAATDRFITAAASLCRQVNITEVKMIWEFMQQYACYAEPIFSPPGRQALEEKGWIFPEFGTHRPESLRFIPLYKADIGQFGDTWDKISSIRGVAVYFNSGKYIAIFPEFEETAIATGVTAIHEGGHALRAVREGRAGKSQRGKEALNVALEEECDMHTMQSTIWRALNRDVYEEMLEQKVSWIQNRLRQQHQKVGCLLVGLPDYDPRLDVILGPAPTDLARSTRKLHLDIIANLETVNRSLLSNKKSVQREMMRAFYQYHKVSLTLP